MLASLSFLTPSGAVLGLAAVLPIGAAVAIARRNARVRRELGLAPPPTASRLVPVLLAAIPLLVALAATQPVISSHRTRHVRTDAQAMFVFDISRSMLASASRTAPTRLAQARQIAIRLRNDAIPDVPSGISTLTTILLPHVVPDDDLAVFDSSVRDSIVDEAPPPPAVGLGLPGTSFSALDPVRDQGYFDPAIRHRVLILLTDGESGPYDAASVADALIGPDQPDELGGPTVANQAPVHLVIVRIGGAHDRVYQPNGAVEPTYQADPRAKEIVDTLATAAHGFAFDATQVAAAGKEARTLLGSGPTKAEGVTPSSVDLAPYIVALACAALALVLWRRNAAAL